jgi:hypothetical protein
MSGLPYRVSGGPVDEVKLCPIELTGHATDPIVVTDRLRHLLCSVLGPVAKPHPDLEVSEHPPQRICLTVESEAAKACASLSIRLTSQGRKASGTDRS